MEYKEDLRIIRTRKLLSDTILSIMEEQSLDRVSVIDLCNRAMVNRATFYAHFEDKYHLLSFALDELKDEIYDKFRCDFIAETPKDTLLKITTMAFDFVRDNRNHVANILRNNRNERVIYTIKDSLNQSIKYQLGKFKDTYRFQVPINIISVCFTGALLDLALWHVDNPDKLTHEEIAAYAAILIEEHIK